jgi:hypothetical protein
MWLICWNQQDFACAEDHFTVIEDEFQFPGNDPRVLLIDMRMARDNGATLQDELRNSRVLAGNHLSRELVAQLFHFDSVPRSFLQFTHEFLLRVPVSPYSAETASDRPDMVPGNADGVNSILFDGQVGGQSSVKMHRFGMTHEGRRMAAQPNVAGIARLLYVAAGAALVAWGLWGADQGWTQWAWLLLGGIVLVLGMIAYSPLHALFGTKDQKAS